MKKTAFLLAALTAVLPVFAGVKDFPWCTVDVPDAWTPDTGLTVKVTPKAGIPEGLKVACDLHFMKAKGWGGVLGCYQRPKDAVAGTEAVFTFKPAYREDMVSIDAFVFLAPDGDFKRKVSDAHNAIAVKEPKFKPSVCPVLTNDYDWCTVELPSKWAPGTSLPAKITLKKTIPEGMKVACDLHWSTKDKWKGSMGDYMAPKDAVPGATVEFRHKPPCPDELHYIDVFCFLAPNGSFEKRVKDCHNKVMFDYDAPPLYEPLPKSVTFKKSFLRILGTDGPVAKGGKLVLRVKYHLDESDTWGDEKTSVMVMPLGPWIDNPDGKINESRKHVGYWGLHPLKKPVEPGEGELAFEWEQKQVFRYNSCFFLCRFVRPDGKDWPWDIRGGGAEILRENRNFILEAVADGGMYPYGTAPLFQVVWGANAASGEFTGKTMVVKVTDMDGEMVFSKQISVKMQPGKPAARFALNGFDKHGIFSITASIKGMGESQTFFGTMPAFVRQEGRRTPFGATDISTPGLSKLAADMGFSYVRHFTGWSGLESFPGEYNFAGLDKTIEANTSAGLAPWISLQGAPSWALPEGIHGFGFEPAPVDMKAWGRIVKAVSERYKGKLYGWEWLNEIVPGNKCADPVATYLEMCKTGTEAAKAVDPSLVIQLAGGLWPHNFRADLLNAGVGKYIDVLPVHYSDYAGVAEARRDVEAAGLKNVVVADNESAAGMSTWEMTPEQMLAMSEKQCLHVMTRWPDVLCAGAAFVVYFGGAPQAAGNWTYLLDAHTPRPVAVTLAVVQSKLAYAKPLGKFFMDGAVVHLFENGGKAVCFVRAAGEGKKEVRIPAAGPLTVTDFLGRETVSADGFVTAADMPVIVEGGDLNALKFNTVCSIGSSSVPVQSPQVTAQSGAVVKVPIRISNPYDAERSFKVVATGAEWGTPKAETVTVAAGAEKLVEATVTVDDGETLPKVSSLVAKVTADGLGKIERPFRLFVIDSSASGNLLDNGGFEKGLASWGGNGKLVDAPLPGLPGNHAMAINAAGKGNYQSQTQSVTIPVPGETYLYTAWVWGQNMGGGSNIGERYSNGQGKNYYIPNVFSVGDRGSQSWRFLSKQLRTSDITTKASFTPVGAGEGGRLLFDNISLTRYKGSDFAALAGKGQAPAESSLVPLLCDNQIQTSGKYTWSPSNLAGVGRFSWDDKALTLVVNVEDDVLQTVPVTTESGEETLGGDAIALSLFPVAGGDGFDNTQVRWYISKASPGGGSGGCTLYRPAKYACGGKSGQLAKDSSVYSLSITRNGTVTSYELRIPWAEIPGFAPAAGATLGCNLVLFDADGKGGTGRMTWGAGLRDDAYTCGTITLLP